MRTTSATSCTSTASSSPWTRSTWWVLTSTSTARRPRAAHSLYAPLVRQNFTVCLSGWDQRVYYPNQAMLKAQFVNLSKSLNKWEVIYVYVDADTSPSILLKIQEECDRVKLEHKGEYGVGWRCRFAASEPPYKLGIEMVFEYSVGVERSHALTLTLTLTLTRATRFVRSPAQRDELPAHGVCEIVHVRGVVPRAGLQRRVVYLASNGVGTRRPAGQQRQRPRPLLDGGPTIHVIA